ncbi:DUF6266 family protein [Pedobacter hartonius]|uniref:Uncharacterized protein n=1 Tax=Pedobacter hartonius TaxID=425514 RepID=A0A1H4CXM3_9SPHI|nr:DUF6266 family protein [Pedobacter hartonius]SEA65205.1 hypothetical protein SAMN05443550_104241 [Pedobacter hartonius]
MATVLKGFLDGFRGLLGNAVGAKWRTLYVIKGRPSKSSKPPTPAQLAQQMKFGLATGFVSTMGRIIKIGYQSYTNTTTTPNNAAVQQILTDAITGIYPAVSIDYAKVAISKGKLESVYGATAVAAPEGTAKVSWTVNSSETDLNQDTDYVIAVFYDTTINKYLLNMKIATRKDLSFVASFPFVFYGHPVQGWMFLVSADGKRVSNSEYLGQLLITA